MRKNTLYILDVMPLLFRAHFATIGKRFANSSGIDTRISLVFFNYIFQVLNEERPGAIAAVLDSKPQQREEASSGSYKANREKMPGEISEAFPYVMRLLKALRIPVFKEQGYEADDIIATLAEKAARLGYTVYIVSPDKDLAQLVSKKIFLFRPAYKGATLETLDEEGVRKKFGVVPDQIPDFLALKGDAVDNIPGVPGIGDKTAAALLEEHGSVENLLKNVSNVKQQKIRESLMNAREQVIKARQLTLLARDVDITVRWEDLEVKGANEEQLFELLDELEFNRIKERIRKQGIAGQAPAALKADQPAMHVNVKTISITELRKQLKGTKEVAIGYTPAAPAHLYLHAGLEQHYRGKA
jgi:DNA polymerase I